MLAMVSGEEGIATILLFVWVIFVAEVLTKKLYGYMVRRSIPQNVAVYYNRKVIHVLTGGVVAAVVPFVFRTPLLPFTMAMFLAFFLYIPYTCRRNIRGGGNASGNSSIHIGAF